MIFTTACPRNCYSTCTMKVTVDNGRLTAVEAHPGNRATSGGVCLKGLSYVERVHSPDRLLHPLVRKQGTAEFARISWAEAVDRIAGKLTDIRARFGPQAVLYYAGSGTKGILNDVADNFWKLFGGCTKTYGDLCWPAGLEATRLTLGENKHNAPWDIANAKLIILWGKNPAETNIQQMSFIRQAIENGATIVVIDPRRTESSESADLHLQPQPGTDAALALAVARELIGNNRIDKQFIDDHVAGFERFRDSVAGLTPEKASAITGVPEAAIERLAELLGAVRPATINAGFGMQRYTNAGQTMRSLIALLALTGNIGKPGAGWVYANLQSHVFTPVKDPVHFYPPERPDGIFRVSVSTARLGADILAASDPPLKMIWVERGNPLPQNPESPVVLRALRALDFRVVVDQFLTDTAREADIVLPAKTMFEQTDVINAYWHGYIQLKQKVLEPPGEVKPETEVYRLLAARLGFSDAELRGIIPGPSDAEIDEYLEAKLKPLGLSLALLRDGPVLAAGHEEVAFADLRFTTPSGKIELASAEARERWGVDELPAYVPPVETASDGRLVLLAPNTKNRIHSQFGNLAMIQDVSGVPCIYLNREDAVARGIGTGDRVRVFNERGSLQVEARLDYSLRAGVAVIYNGWWIDEGAAVNFLSKARETDMGYGAAFHENVVQVEKL